MNNIIPIPHSVMRVLNCNWDIDWRSQSSGEGLDGVEQVFPSPFPRWVGSPRLSLYGDALRLWRATKSKARGRANLYRVPMIDHDNIPDAYGQEGPSPGIVGDGPTVNVVHGAGVGGTYLVVSHGTYPILVGSYVSVADWPYTVEDVVRDGKNWGVQIGMPLRRAVMPGAVVNLRAHGLFRAAEDGMGAIDVGPNGFAQVDLSFVEWLGPGRA